MILAKFRFEKIEYSRRPPLPTLRLGSILNMLNCFADIHQFLSNATKTFIATKFATFFFSQKIPGLVTAKRDGQITGNGKSSTCWSRDIPFLCYLCNI
jgi:hypothetical protein